MAAEAAYEWGGGKPRGLRLSGMEVLQRVPWRNPGSGSGGQSPQKLKAFRKICAQFGLI